MYYLADVSRCFPSLCGFWRCSWSRREKKALVACGREAGSRCPSANRGARREVWHATGPPTPGWLIKFFKKKDKNITFKFRNKNNLKAGNGWKTLIKFKCPLWEAAGCLLHFLETGWVFVCKMGVQYVITSVCNVGVGVKWTVLGSSDVNK